VYSILSEEEVRSDYFDFSRKSVTVLIPDITGTHGDLQNTYTEYNTVVIVKLLYCSIYLLIFYCC
jgi:hypothetical protein